MQDRSEKSEVNVEEFNLLDNGPQNYKRDLIKRKSSPRRPATCVIASDVNIKELEYEDLKIKTLDNAPDNVESCETIHTNKKAKFHSTIANDKFEALPELMSILANKRLKHRTAVTPNINEEVNDYMSTQPDIVNPLPVLTSCPALTKTCPIQADVSSTPSEQVPNNTPIPFASPALSNVKNIPDEQQTLPTSIEITIPQPVEESVEPVIINQKTDNEVSVELVKPIVSSNFVENIPDEQQTLPTTIESIIPQPVEELVEPVIMNQKTDNEVSVELVKIIVSSNLVENIPDEQQALPRSIESIIPESVKESVEPAVTMSHRTDNEESAEFVKPIVSPDYDKKFTSKFQNNIFIRQNSSKMINNSVISNVTNNQITPSLESSSKLQLTNQLNKSNQDAISTCEKPKSPIRKIDSLINRFTPTKNQTNNLHQGSIGDVSPDFKLSASTFELSNKRDGSCFSISNSQNNWKNESSYKKARDVFIIENASAKNSGSTSGQSLNLSRTSDSLAANPGDTYRKHLNNLKQVECNRSSTTTPANSSVPAFITEFLNKKKQRNNQN